MNAATVSHGLHFEVPDAEYRAWAGLSSTGLKHLLDSPARYQHEQTHRTEKKAFDLGHAVHQRVLGVGPEIVAIPDDLLASDGAASTKAAKGFIAEARAAGQVPLKKAEFDQIEAAAAAVLNHPDAGPLFYGGAAEVSVLWDDPATGVPCKGRLDYWHERAALAVDLKTTARTADPRKVDRLAADLGWHRQAAHYCDGVEVVTGVRPRFVHVLVEIDAPHLVSVVELNEDYLAIGADDVRLAVDSYAHCLATDEWPSYPTGVHRIAPPRWLGTAIDLEN